MSETKGTAKRLRAAIAGAAAGLAAMGLRLWQASLQGGPWWVAADLIVGTLVTIGIATAAVLLGRTAFPPGGRHGTRTTFLAGLGCVAAVALIRWLSFASSGTSPIPGDGSVSLILDVLLTLVGWSGAFLIALAGADWFGGRSGRGSLDVPSQRGAGSADAPGWRQ